MAHWVEESFERPDPSLVQRARCLPTAVISDSMNRLQAMDAGIRSLAPGRRLCGPAFTVQSVEACNQAAHEALGLVQRGDVLVIAARGGTMAAVWGHLMTVAARNAGLAGVVIDGCVRDAADNAKDPLPIFSRGTCPAGPHKGWPGNLNVPVACGGVAVLPGDLVIGDDDGVVVIPAKRIVEVLDGAEARAEAEKRWFEQVEQGASTAEAIGLSRDDD